MTPIIWSPQAAEEIVGIQTYISGDSVQYADLVVRRIVARVEQLARFPQSGRIVPERRDAGLKPGGSEEPAAPKKGLVPSGRPFVYIPL